MPYCLQIVLAESWRLLVELLTLVGCSILPGCWNTIVGDLLEGGSAGRMLESARMSS